jgi:hypothetical protein
MPLEEIVMELSAFCRSLHREDGVAFDLSIAGFKLWVDR